MTAFNESQAIPLLRLGVASGWRSPAKAQKGMRVPAGDMERLVLERLRAFFSSRIDIGQADGIAHLAKGSAGKDPVERIMGSIALMLGVGVPPVRLRTVLSVLKGAR